MLVVGKIECWGLRWSARARYWLGKIGPRVWAFGLLLPNPIIRVQIQHRTQEFSRIPRILNSARYSPVSSIIIICLTPKSCLAAYRTI
jgi:hypothetical protein